MPTYLMQNPSIPVQEISPNKKQKSFQKKNKLALGVSKEWNQSLVNQSSLFHDVSDNLNESLPYQEEHSRDNTFKKIKRIEISNIFNRNQSSDNNNTNYLQRNNTQTQTPSYRNDLRMNSSDQESQELVSRQDISQSNYKTTQDKGGRTTNLTPLKKVSNRLMVNVNRDKLRDEISQIYSQNIASKKSESVFSTDLKNYATSFNIKEQFVENNKSKSLVRIPLNPVKVYNCLTDQISEYQPPDIKIYEDSKFQSNYQRLLSQEKSFNKKIGYFTYEVKNKQELQRHLRNNQSMIQKDDRENQYANKDYICERSLGRVSIDPSIDRISVSIHQKGKNIMSSHLESQKLSKRSQYSSTKDYTQVQQFDQNQSQSRNKIFMKNNKTIANQLLNMTDSNAKETDDYRPKLISINEKSVKNLIGGEMQVDQIKCFFRNNRKGHKSVQPNMRHNHRLTYMSKNEIQRMEQQQDFMNDTMYKHMIRDIEHLDEFEDKFCKDNSIISNLPRMKHKYNI
ncbi:UNKNOWN [Stylonychia lemnae]|uniref:Uncharacterized protein n=1 Tax=Stylonychia lemnae TaxID=5949 RepID=A0A078A976_STYLE|nr:UNKNOWN [Stylonychia lemnae]|eukprot:CDW78127.1 UNKNOWN [Stylonychia lemnae]